MVGDAHMFSQTGILPYLASQGFTIVRFTPDGRHYEFDYINGLALPKDRDAAGNPCYPASDDDVHAAAAASYEDSEIPVVEVVKVGTVIEAPNDHS